MGKSRIGIINSKQLTMKEVPKHKPREILSFMAGIGVGALIMTIAVQYFKPK